MDKKDIASFGYDELIEEMKQIGEKPFRAKQIYSWLHEKLADSFDEMTNLSKAFREKLDHEYEIKKVTMAARQISQVDPTEKFLFELEDGNMIESVLMKYNYGIPSAFPHRWDVAWGAVSVHLPLTVWNAILLYPRC